MMCERESVEVRPADPPLKFADGWQVNLLLTMTTSCAFVLVLSSVRELDREAEPEDVSVVQVRRELRF